MLDNDYFLKTLRANGLSESSSKEEVNETIATLQLKKEEIDELIPFLKKKGWLTMENPFEQIKVSRTSLFFLAREYFKTLKTKILKERVYIDDPLQKTPSFNLMKTHIHGVEKNQVKEPSVNPPVAKYLIRRVIRNLFIISIIIGIIYLIYSYRFSLLSFYWTHF